MEIQPLLERLTLAGDAGPGSVRSTSGADSVSVIGGTLAVRRDAF